MGAESFNKIKTFSCSNFAYPLSVLQKMHVQNAKKRVTAI